jgi:tetratricopeptide (TPR) repeat protein
MSSTVHDYVVQGNRLVDDRQYAEAIEAYNRAIETEASTFEAWLGKARALRELGRPEESLKAYDQTLKIRSDDARPWNGKGNALNRLHDYEAALACFDQSIKLDSSYYDPWVNRGRSLDGLARYDEAEVSLNHAITLSPDEPEAYENKAFHYATINNASLSIENLRKAIALNPICLDRGILAADFLDPIAETEEFKQFLQEFLNPQE